MVLAEQGMPRGVAADLVYVLHRGSVTFAGEPGELDPLGVPDRP